MAPGVKGGGGCGDGGGGNAVCVNAYCCAAGVSSSWWKSTAYSVMPAGRGREGKGREGKGRSGEWEGYAAVLHCYALLLRIPAGLYPFISATHAIAVITIPISFSVMPCALQYVSI